MAPQTLTTDAIYDEDPSLLPIWVRGILIGMALVLVAVFSVALWLSPYDEDGSPKRMETHRGLGLPPCSFYEMTGRPCPSCGMTTSFALFVRFDLLDSLRANWVGTLLAATCLCFIPWAVVSVVRGQMLFIRSLERMVVVGILSLLGMMLLRWAIVLILLEG